MVRRSSTDLGGDGGDEQGAICHSSGVGLGGCPASYQDKYNPALRIFNLLIKNQKKKVSLIRPSNENIKEFIDLSGEKKICYVI